MKITKEFRNYTPRYAGGKGAGAGFWRWDHYESFSDFRKVVGGPSWNKNYEAHRDYGLTEGGAWDWTNKPCAGPGCKCADYNTGERTTCKEFEELAVSGWQEGVDKALKNLRALDIPIMPDFRRKLQRDCDGDDLDIGAVWNGNLDRAWTVAKRQSYNGRPKMVRLLCEVTLSGAHSAEQSFWRGAATIAIADALEQAGIPVEIWGYSSGPAAINDNKHIMVSVCVHDAGEPLNLSKVALLSHVWFERFYAWRALTAVEGSTGVGGCCPWPFELEEGDVTIDQVFSKEAAQKRIEEVLSGVRQSIENSWLQIYGDLNFASNTGDVDKSLRTE